MREYLEACERHRAKHEEKKPKVETWDEQELRARCELSKPNFNRASPDKQRKIKAAAMSHKLGRYLN